MLGALERKHSIAEEIIFSWRLHKRHISSSLCPLFSWDLLVVASVHSYFPYLAVSSIVSRGGGRKEMNLKD